MLKEEKDEAVWQMASQMYFWFRNRNHFNSRGDSYEGGPLEEEFTSVQTHWRENAEVALDALLEKFEVGKRPTI